MSERYRIDMGQILDNNVSIADVDDNAACESLIAAANRAEAVEAEYKRFCAGEISGADFVEACQAILPYPLPAAPKEVNNG